MQRTIFLLAATVCAVLATTFQTTNADANTDPWQGEMPVRQPWLRDHLPDDALIYARIPHLFGLFATPKGNALDAALRSETNVENVMKVRKGIVDNVLMHIPVFSDLRLRMIEQHLRSPIEVASFFVPAPSVLVAVNLDLEGRADFEDALAAFALETPGFGLLAPLDAEGVGQLEGAGVPVFLQFDEDSGRLLVNAGPAVSAESFANVRAGLDRREAHRMREMEARVDESGQGLFFWINAEQALPTLQMFVQPEQFERLIALGLDKVSAAGFGLGVADGKGRLSLLVDMPAESDRGFVPYVRNELDARSVGSPDGLMLLSIPGPAEYARMETLALSTANEEGVADWHAGKELFREYAGVTLREALGAVGPDLVVIFDEAGDYGALRLRDAALWDRMVANVAEKVGREPERRRIGGDTYYHLSVPNEFGMMDEESAEELGWAAVLLRRQRDHLYWTRDDDYLYLASTPQVLIDRNAAGARTDVGGWLADDQRIDARHAIVSMSGTTRKLPQRMYAIYIELLQALADIAQADIDVWSMPTSDQLGLPELGTLGFTVNLGDPTLAAELTFENNPGEFLGGLGGVAAIGIVAAVAIPAYQDYTVRAKVSSGLNAAGAVKTSVAEYHARRGAFPFGEEAAAMSVTDAGEHVREIEVEGGTGRIVIEYVDGAIPDGGVMILEPSVAPGGMITWTCGGTMAGKYQPSSCRGNPAAVGAGS